MNHKEMQKLKAKVVARTVCTLSAYFNSNLVTIAFSLFHASIVTSLPDGVVMFTHNYKNTALL